MQNYKTTEEKSIEWGVTPKTVQILCRHNKIKGAIKRSGVWFVPDDAPNPLKNTKSNAQPFNFVGTKKKVFESAIRLFVLKGVENVTVRDVTEDVGIAQSAIYNHFSSKQDLLNTVYDYYNHYFLANRPNLEDLEPTLKAGSPLDILLCVRYEFNEDIRQKLSDIAKIILQRQGADEAAMKISKTLIIDEGIKFTEAVFNRAIELGRVERFDVHLMAVLVNSIRVYSFYNWVVDSSPENIQKIRRYEEELLSLAAKNLKPLTPKNKE